MSYGDELEREMLAQMHEWRDIRYWRYLRDLGLPPDERLDELGWEIFYCAVMRGMEPDDAAALAMDGNYRLRGRVAEDLWKRENTMLKRRIQELQPAALTAAFKTHAPEQLAFWGSRVDRPSYVYFVQDGEAGPVKIGVSIHPDQRLRKLQTGNPRTLLLRHVIPGDRMVEEQLHQRFEPARIRGEWFGREYLPVVLAFAGGLAESMMRAYDGSGVPVISGAAIRSESEVTRIRRDIESRWLRGFRDLQEIADLLWLERDEVEDHVIAMSKSTIWDIPARVGQRYEEDRVCEREVLAW